MNETEYSNTWEYGSHYVKMVHTMAARFQFCSNFLHKYTTLISTIKLASKHVGFPATPDCNWVKEVSEKQFIS